jgi:hypothetical protein
MKEKILQKKIALGKLQLQDSIATLENLVEFIEAKENTGQYMDKVNETNKEVYTILKTTRKVKNSIKKLSEKLKFQILDSFKKQLNSNT